MFFIRQLEVPKFLVHIIKDRESIMLLSEEKRGGSQIITFDRRGGGRGSRDGPDLIMCKGRMIIFYHRIGGGLGGNLQEKKYRSATIEQKLSKHFWMK